jgi:hypothetical protein
MTLRILMAFAAIVCLMPPATSVAAETDDVAAGGAFTCDFNLPGDLPFDQVPAILERDRMFMAARPGFTRKLVPLRIDPATGGVSSGGRYLFATKEDADAYREWVTREFALDGTLFLERPYFLSPDCRSWAVIGAHDFTDIHSTHVVVRTERWSVPSDNQRKLLKERWPAVRAAAAAQGLSSVWLLYNKQEDVVSLVSVADRVAPPDPYAPDFTSLFALEYAPSVGAVFNDAGWSPMFDRTSWVLTTWFPFHSGDTGEPSLWPNSPPFPEPYTDDGVCEGSRGENGDTAPSDCVPTCGDGVAQPGETNLSCPADVRTF